MKYAIFIFAAVFFLVPSYYRDGQVMPEQNYSFLKDTVNFILLYGIAYYYFLEARQ